MQRVAVVGSSGVGKSRLSETMGAALDLPVIELDALMHGPDWTPTPTPEFRSKVMSAIADAERGDSRGGWVVPGNYRTVSDIVQRRADTIVWMDLPRWVTTRRLVWRSLSRSLTRQRVWGDNRERLRDLFSRSAERNVVLWSWRHHDDYAQMYQTYADGEFWSHATVHRLRTTGEVDSFVESLTN